MKNIEIKTTQNVVLQYELADLRDRIMAFVLDLICLTVSIAILSFIGFGLFRLSDIAGTIFSIFLSMIFVFYSLVLEVRNNGQSIGKMALKIQVIKTEGGQATFSDYAARWVFRMIDIYFSLGGIASILVASSAKAQRIGDIVANTAVVKEVPKVNLKLKDLLTFHSKSSYTPTYMQAKNLREDDVLLIKIALQRYRQFNNAAHEEALVLLANKIKQVLLLEGVQGNEKLFLQTILSDYVVLTR
jgi:uncharacterized RDD family membrane protein YckC